MTAKAYKRGWPIIFYDNKWIYADSGESIKIERPCIRCGKMPTLEGHDACLGTIPNVIAACCGHGVEKPYTIYKEKNKRRNQMKLPWYIKSAKGSMINGEYVVNMKVRQPALFWIVLYEFVFHPWRTAKFIFLKSEEIKK